MPWTLRPGDLEEQWAEGLRETPVSAGTGRQPPRSREALTPRPRNSPPWAESLSWNPLEGTASVAPLTPGCPPQPRPSWRLSRHQASRDIPIGLYQVLLGAQAQHVQRGHGHHAGDHGEGPWLELSHGLGPSLWAGPGLPGDACNGSPSPRGTGQNEAAHPLPQDLRDSPRPCLPLPQAWARGQPSSPSQPPRPEPVAQSPEGHDHHQGDDGPLQEARADTGLLRDHRRRLRKREEAERPRLREPMALPTGVLREVGVPGGLIPMGAEAEEGKAGLGGPEGP